MIWEDLSSFFQADIDHCGWSSQRWEHLLECGKYTTYALSWRYRYSIYILQLHKSISDRNTLGGTGTNGTNIFINLGNVNNGNTR